MGVLSDLRAYWQRNTKPCGVEKPEPGPQLGWLCTLPKGHRGAHVAHDIDGTLIVKWTRPIPPAKSDGAS